ncbi:hypothetical protein [Lichenicoccus sp.]|uniref:hypothetical protein n=1 Tax=Lichenicoccus sp. TaxID=2781899 RepID=UPI003D1276E5
MLEAAIVLQLGLRDYVEAAVIVFLLLFNVGLFVKLLLPLLDYGRERQSIDLSALKLAHYKTRDLGQQKLNLEHNNAPDLLQPISDGWVGHRPGQAEALSERHHRFDK